VSSNEFVFYHADLYLFVFNKFFWETTCKGTTFFYNTVCFFISFLRKNLRLTIFIHFVNFQKMTSFKGENYIFLSKNNKFYFIKNQDFIS